MESTDLESGMEPNEWAFSVREAAVVCGVSPSAIRRKVRAGVFPNAEKLPSGAWRIPVSDLEGAGLTPNGAAPMTAASRSTAVELVGLPVLEEFAGTAPYAHLRVELGEAVAMVQTERIHSELEKWQIVADERERSLARADLAMDTVARAVESAAIISQAAVEVTLEPAQEDDVAPAAPAPPASRAAAPPIRGGAASTPSGAAEIPPDVRAEARRYAESLRSARGTHQRRKWRDIWR